jgi:flagellin-like hook-associated protein FlgL
VEANNGTANEDTAHGVTAYNGDMAIFDGLSRLGTGTYQVKVDEVAASSTEGTLNVLTSVAGNNGQVTLGTVAGAASELANGTSSIEITGYNTGTHALSYSLNGVAQSDVTISGDDTEINLGNTGLTVSLADYGAAVQNGTYTIDYVQSDTARMQLQTASGTAIAVDADGSDGAPNATSTYFYVTASNTYNTGKGLQVTAGDLTALTNNKGSVSSFDYVQANDNSVNVSTAELASNYMTTVNAALDTVNRSMADLGSLMARMSIKEEAVTSSQINVESSYNRIMNANMAEEQVNASKYLILQQTATAMLAQANTAPQFLLSLFQ